MNKTELIEHIAEQADISKASAARALEATIGAITETLKAGDAVALVGLVLLPLAFALPAPVAIHALAMRLKSKKPKFQSSVQAKPSKTR